MKQVDACNAILLDAFGLSPNGLQLYKWIHSSDLLTRRLVNGTPQDVAVIEGNRWVLAMWQAPPPRKIWDAENGSIEYPAHGFYFPTDIILHPGVLPTEDLTYLVKAKRDAFDRLSPWELRNALEEGREATRKSKTNRQMAIVEDAMFAFNHIPGKRDHVSFGGI